MPKPYSLYQTEWCLTADAVHTSPHWLSPNDWEIGPPQQPTTTNAELFVELRHRRSRMSCWQFLRPDSRCWSTQSAHPQKIPQTTRETGDSVCRRFCVGSLPKVWPVGSSNRNGGVIYVMFRVECSFFRWCFLEQTTFTEEGQHPIQKELGALKPICVFEQGVLTQQLAVFHNWTGRSWCWLVLGVLPEWFEEGTAKVVNWPQGVLPPQKKTLKNRVRKRCKTMQNDSTMPPWVSK